MNKVIIDGRILKNTEKAPHMYAYYPGDAANNKKSVLSMVISSQKNYGKADENGYYPSSLFTVKAFGPKADFINKYFQPGSSILVEGTLEVEHGAEKEDGTRYPDRVVIYLDNQYFCARGANDGEKSASSGVAVSSSRPAAKKVNLSAPF